MTGDDDNPRSTINERSRLSEWLRHRQIMLGIASPEDLAEAAAISPDTVATILQTGTLRHVGRSARSFIARALKITVRDLEALASGKIDWIDDSRVVDFDRLAPAPLRIARGDFHDQLYPIACRPEIGIPIVGRILGGGVAEFYGDPSAIELDRLPLRYAASPDAFALHLLERDEPYAPRSVEIFDGLPPGQLRADQFALITPDMDESLVGRIRSNSGEQLLLETSDGREMTAPLEAVVRAAVRIGSEPF